EVPPVLVSGNHGNIDKWRLEESKKITKDRRPDLWDKYQASHREDNKKKRRTRKAD
ncbi:MAG: tRNA (guanosine(37)-N1)-methyltransferase TrmD, partial [Peptostreptococcus sp.]|nr:tRNA (guanosine(37)-N1)-methyltransferase TrmD [Peptostreptococcus sp.]